MTLELRLRKGNTLCKGMCGEILRYQVFLVYRGNWIITLKNKTPMTLDIDLD